MTTLFRIFLIIPIGIVIAVLTAGATQVASDRAGDDMTTTTGGIPSALFLATVLTIDFRRRYPRWWFDFARELSRFGMRVGAYLALLTDDYPSTEDEQSVHLGLTTPTPRRT